MPQFSTARAPDHDGRALAKATQLVVPCPADHIAAPAPASPSGPIPLTPRVDAALLPACLAELSQALTTHLGPVAQLLVKRHAAAVGSPSELIDVLAREIPAEAERPQFLLRAREVVARQRG